MNLKLRSATGDLVTYELELSSPSGEWRGVARLVPSSGEVTMGDWEAAGEAPQWLRATTHAILRSVWRSRQIDGAGADWPRRLTRWRAEPTGSGA